MTDDGLTFWEVLGQPGSEDFLRSLRERVLEQLRDFAVTNRIRAGRHERTDARQTHRNGYRERPPRARLGALELKVPKWRQGNYFPSFLEPRRLTEQALTAVLQEAWIGGRATRKGDDPVQALGMTGISKSQGSALCRDIDARVDSFLNRPIEGEWPYLWLDATYLNGRKGGRVGSVAAIIAGGANQDGRRELLGLGPGDSEAQGFWVEFPRSLRQRGLPGVRLVIADAHAGLKAAIRQVVTASWQRCRVRFPRNRLAGVPKASQSLVGTLVRQVFVQPDAQRAQTAWRQVADRLRPRFPKAAEPMDQAEADVLAHLRVPTAHRVNIHSTNPLERLNKEVKRRANVVGIFPNEASIRRPIGAVLMEQNEEWPLQHRYLPQHTMVADTGTEPGGVAALPAT